MKQKINLLVNVCLALLLAVTTAWSAFDPVNDDTDIFLANPNITAERPNILIILDNTANWNVPFTNEKAALVSVVGSLTSSFNVGLMMMPETGGGNDSVDGGYVRFHVRQMIDANKNALRDMVGNLIQSGPGSDVGNNATHGAALYEAYLYYAGLASVASFGKVKTDHDGTTDTLLQPLAGPHALPANPTASSLYRSPIVDGCQKNFIILISNGKADNNVTEGNTMESRITALTGSNAIIPLTRTGAQSNWSDEMSRYMANNDINSQTGAQNVFTYVVEVDPGNQPADLDWSALMESTAIQGKGKYFKVSSEAGGAAIVAALQAIFSEVQAVNSVFASTTLPVSVNVRGTNLNQVYIGVFRPDANKAPRWLGNLKMYNLALNASTGDVFLADASNGPPPATGIPAQNSGTGFVTGAASSFWTADSTFWGFRDPSLNGVGGASDKPDGELVEKGGVAQQLRIAYADAEASATPRNLYTCTNGGFASPGCLPLAGFSLLNTPFSTANTDITHTELALDSRPLFPLTAYATKNVTSVTDRLSVNLDNGSAGSIAVTLSNGGTAVPAITSLNTNVAIAMTSYSGNAAGTAVTGATGSIVKNGTGNSTCTATFAAAVNATQFVVGSVVTLSGFTGSNQNGAVTLTATTPTSITWACSGGVASAAGGPSGTATVVTFPSTTITGTSSAAHGLAVNDQVIISGATPSSLNNTFTVTSVPSTTTFTFSLPIGSTAIGSASAVGTTNKFSTTARATTSGNHLLTTGTGNNVTISGATPSGYNCATPCNITVVNATTFTYTVGSKLSPATVNPTVLANGTTTVTGTTLVAHGFIPGQVVSINGAAPYNGLVTLITASGTTFTYSTAPTVLGVPSGGYTVGSGTSNIVTATTVGGALHGFVSGNIIIESTSATPDGNHPGTWALVTVPTTSTFTYDTLVAKPSPTGNFTVRPQVSKAYVTLPAHGYSDLDQILISNASPAGYNGVHTITVLDANTFTYPLMAALGTNVATGVTASKATMTATATSVAHGFANGSTVTITGATPVTSPFNGTFTVTVGADPNTFTYPLSVAQGNATGSPVAVQAGGTGRDDLIRWVRGQDNFQDENINGSSTDIRASIHGDVLHSKPAVINYNRYGSDNDVYVYYGSNDGIFRGIKGGYATDASAAVQIAPGNEAWGFIPPEFFDELNRQRINSPIVSSSFKKSYFADGSIGVYTKDTNSNDSLGDVGDKVNLYISMRRGGRLIYALDVNNPHDPKFLWKIDNTTTGFAELGQTWSQPTVVEGLAGYPDPVLVFGGGYDPTIEDLDPATITASTATTVTANAVTYTRSMGRAIYVVNALTGALLWRAVHSGIPAADTKIVSGMDYAIPSDVTIIKNETTSITNRGYVGDTGGNMWRIDFRWDNVNGWANTLVTQLASVGGSGAVKRKFMYPPDVIAGGPGFAFDAVLIGTGDREHPFETTVTNRFYMFRDTGNDLGPLTGTTGAVAPNPYIVESAMFDATNNCIQDAGACAAGVTPSIAQTALNAASGWYITLLSGEKVVGNALALGGTVFFNTNQPSASAGGGTCGSNLGIARQYQVSATDATATNNLDNTGGITGSDRSSVIAGGGYLPPPVHVVVELGGKTVEAVVSGITVTEPPGVTLQARLRKFWYKEID